MMSLTFSNLVDSLGPSPTLTASQEKESTVQYLSHSGITGVAVPVGSLEQWINVLRSNRCTIFNF